MDIMSTLISALIGICVVFAVLILLMLIISIMSKIMKSGKKVEQAANAPVAPAANVAPKAARGSCGEVKLFDVPDKTAAQLMAITADKLGTPLNTLRFISIKEVK